MRSPSLLPNLPSRVWLSIEDELSQEMLALVKETRLNNVISKIGRVSRNDEARKQQLLQLLMQDILETFNEEWDSLFSALPPERQQLLIEKLQQESKKLVDGYYY